MNLSHRTIHLILGLIQLLFDVIKFVITTFTILTALYFASVLYCISVPLLANHVVIC